MSYDSETKMEAPSRSAAEVIMESRLHLLPGFKRFRRATRIQTLTQKLSEAISIVQRVSTHLKFHNATLAEWANGENWVTRVTHANSCALERLDALTSGDGECTCAPLTQLIWNGDPDLIQKSHAVLGALEKATKVID